MLEIMFVIIKASESEKGEDQNETGRLFKCFAWVVTLRDSLKKIIGTEREF